MSRQTIVASINTVTSRFLGGGVNIMGVKNVEGRKMLGATFGTEILWGQARISLGVRKNFLGCYWVWRKH